MPEAIIIWIVLDEEKNIADQRHLEYAINEKDPNIEIVRCTLPDLYKIGYLNENKSLF